MYESYSKEPKDREATQNCKTEIPHCLSSVLLRGCFKVKPLCLEMSNFYAEKDQRACLHSEFLIFKFLVRKMASNLFCFLDTCPTQRQIQVLRGLKQIKFVSPSLRKGMQNYRYKIVWKEYSCKIRKEITINDCRLNDSGPFLWDPFRQFASHVCTEMLSGCHLTYPTWTLSGS